MGFSPGEFMSVDDGQLHWEYSGGKIILWGPEELKMLMAVTKADAFKMLNQLQILCQMIELEDDIG